MQTRAFLPLVSLSALALAAALLGASVSSARADTVAITAVVIFCNLT